MRNFNITVNGTAYNVAVEEVGVGETGGAVASAPAPVQAAKPTPKKPDVAEAPPVVSGTGEKVTSPMPGTLLKILCKVGDSVKKGDPVFILEAMKMEHEIVAPIDGRVTSISAKESAPVDSGLVLATVQ
jgi:biotin carboxyl carrier protein